MLDWRQKAEMESVQERDSADCTKANDCVTLPVRVLDLLPTKPNDWND
jgi:hypothetical protein